MCSSWLTSAYWNNSFNSDCDSLSPLRRSTRSRVFLSVSKLLFNLSKLSLGQLIIEKLFWKLKFLKASSQFVRKRSTQPHPQHATACKLIICKLRCLIYFNFDACAVACCCCRLCGSDCGERSKDLFQLRVRAEYELAFSN